MVLSTLAARATVAWHNDDVDELCSILKDARSLLVPAAELALPLAQQVGTKFHRTVARNGSTCVLVCVCVCVRTRGTGQSVGPSIASPKQARRCCRSSQVGADG